MQTIVLITGPVASGTTTVARHLAARARGRGLQAASIDMDDLVFMVNGPDWRTVNPTHWSAARHAAAALADVFYASGASVVAVAGPFFGRSEREDLITTLHANPAIAVVVLEVGLDEAIARASSDPTRTLSKDPVLLAQLEKSINWKELPADAIRLPTGGRTVEDIAARADEQIFGAH